MSSIAARSAHGRFVADVLTPFVITRLLLIATGYASLLWIPPDAHGLSIAWRFPLPKVTHPLVEMWMRWDAEWYPTIAAIGYTAPVNTPDIRAGFFPLYPALIRVVQFVVRDYGIAALLIANIAALGFLALLRNVVEAAWGEAAARRTIWMYLAYPSSFYLSSAYAEPVLLFFYAVAWWSLHRGNPGAGGIALGLATLARPTGVLAVPGFAWMWWTRPGPRREQVRAVLAIAAAVGAALAIYFAFSAWTFHDAFATFKLQAAARAPFSWPWRSFATLFEYPEWLGWGNSEFDAILAIIAVILLPVVAWRLGAALALIAAPLAIVPLCSGLMTYSRSFLVVFPLFVLLGVVVRHRALLCTLVTAMLALQLWLFALFVAWYWVA